MSKIIKDLRVVHPLLKTAHHRIQKEVIDAYNIPMRLFETGRTTERHMQLVNKGKENSLISPFIFNLESDPILYSTALSYVYFDQKWSWNLRDGTIRYWYLLFGNLILDECPELEWGANNRKNQNFSLFSLNSVTVNSNQNKIPCVAI